MCYSGGSRNSRYIGSVPVKAAVGNDVAEMAVARLAELGGKEHAVRVVVTTMGLYVVEKGSGDTLKEVRIGSQPCLGASPPPRPVPQLIAAPTLQLASRPSSRSEIPPLAESPMRPYIVFSSDVGRRGGGGGDFAVGGCPGLGLLSA